MPLVAFEPPGATQEVALVDDQVSVEVPLAAIKLGDAFKVTVGAEGGVTPPLGLPTLTATDWLILPPAPEQVRVKTEPEVRLLVVNLPETAFAPLQEPLARQPLAFSLDQIIVVTPL